VVCLDDYDVKPTLKLTATIYVCSDWRTSLLIAPVLEREFCVQNRVTWEREKGRGAVKNWKNNTEIFGSVRCPSNIHLTLRL